MKQIPKLAKGGIIKDSFPVGGDDNEAIMYWNLSLHSRIETLFTGQFNIFQVQPLPLRDRVRVFLSGKVYLMSHGSKQPSIFMRK